MASGGRIHGLLDAERDILVEEGATILPPARTVKAQGKIDRYVEECRERDVPATIPPHEWWGPSGEGG